MKRLALIALLVAASAAAQEGKIEWESDWKTAFDKAAAQHKAVFVDYSATWCVPCQKMELEVLRLPDVQKELARYVPLKVSFSTQSTPVTRAQNVNAYPTFALLDYAGRERFRMTGGRDAPHFIGWLSAVGKEMPPMLTAALFFERNDDVSGWMLVGRTYCEAHLLKEGREALGKARRAAEKAGRPKLVQAAEIALAVTSAYDGKPQRAVDDLTKIAAKPVDDENAAMAWLYIGLSQELLKNEPAAREAFTKVKSLVPPESELAKQATLALAPH